MKLDPTAIHEWLAAKWTGSKLCPVCLQNNWIINPDIFQVPQTLKMQPKRTLIPVLSVSCSNCGYLVFFNLRATDIVDEEGGVKAQFQAKDLTVVVPDMGLLAPGPPPKEEL